MIHADKKIINEDPFESMHWHDGDSRDRNFRVGDTVRLLATNNHLRMRIKQFGNIFKIEKIWNIRTGNIIRIKNQFHTRNVKETDLRKFSI